MKPRLPSRTSMHLFLASAVLLLAACGGGNGEAPPVAPGAPGDSTGPVVTITDSVAEPNATGPVTFTFTFNEDVGTSFTVDDIAVTGGTKGSFTRVSGTRATLEVIPTPNITGTILVSVAAGAALDAQGNGNAVTTSQQAYETVPRTQMALPVNFDSATVAYGLTGFGGAEDSTIVPDPTNPANTVAKVVRAAGAESWAGTTITATTAANVQTGFSPKIPFNVTDTRMSVRVWSPNAGIPVRLKVEDSADPNKSVETEATVTTAAGWQTLTFNFASHVAGTAALNLGHNYNKASIFFDYGRDKATSVQKTYYFDDITFLPGDSVTPPPAGSGTVLLSFDETPPAYADGGAYGGAVATVEPGPAGGSGNALKILKPVSPDTWGGTFFTVARIPFTTDRKMITARVYSTRASAKVSMKLEVPGGASVEVVGTTTGAANTWSTVTWDFGAVDLSKAYTVMAITPDLSLVTTGQSYFIDDITLAAAAAVVPPPVPGAMFLSFDETPPAFAEMGAYGGALPTVEAGPAGGSGNVLKILKPASPDTWGGVFFTTAPIPFTATAKMITANVRSTRAGAVFRLKVEVPGGVSTEVSAAPTGAANTWSTATWDFSTVDLSKSYKIMAITPDADLATTGQTYYVDDIKVITGGGSAGVPVTIATLDEPGAVLTGFEGCWESFLVADPAGGSNKVGKVTKPGSGVPFYCGTTVVTVANGGLTPIAFTDTAKTMTVRVWSADPVGTPVRLKVEDIADPAKFVETDALTTVAGGWQTMSFNFANPASGSPALNLGTAYTKVSIFFDFGKSGTGRTYYFDDITFVTGTGSDTAVVTFDERNYNNTQSQPSILTGFGGAENSTLVGAPDGLPAGGGTGKAAKVVKMAGEVWAGTSVQRKPNDAVPTIPFATGATKMSVRVYSAYAGVRVHLKVEQSGRPDFNSEVDACTTKVNEWETLTFDFGPAGQHFVPGGPCPGGYQTDPNKPGYQPTAQLDVSKTYNKVNIFFDYGLGLAGYDAMPGTRTYYFDDVKFIGQ